MRKSWCILSAALAWLGSSGSGEASIAKTGSLETMLQCAPSTAIAPPVVEARFAGLGLVKDNEGIWRPRPAGTTATLFGAKVVAAAVFDTRSETKVSVYLGAVAVKRLAASLGASEIDEEANTDEPSYVRRTGKRATLLVGAASELDQQAGSIPYESSVTCQITK